MKFQFTCLGLLFCLSLNSFGAEDLPAFHEVNRNILRSGRPTENGLKSLKDSHGIKTIINLEDSTSNVKKEAGWAKNLGLDYLSYPTDSWSRPDDQKVNEVLAILRDQTRYPILIHCKHGEDRTGMMIGLHRVESESWTAQVAYDEMLELGFHKMLRELNKYYKERSGLKKPARQNLNSLEFEN
jgi:tyrosine-protein phosphatase SIW14